MIKLILGMFLKSDDGVQTVSTLAQVFWYLLFLWINKSVKPVEAGNNYNRENGERRIQKMIHKKYKREEQESKNNKKQKYHCSDRINMYKNYFYCVRESNS